MFCPGLVRGGVAFPSALVSLLGVDLLLALRLLFGVDRDSGERGFCREDGTQLGNALDQIQAGQRHPAKYGLLPHWKDRGLYDRRSRPTRRHP